MRGSNVWCHAAEKSVPETNTAATSPAAATPADPKQEKLDAAARIATESLRIAGLIPVAKSAPGRKGQVDAVSMMLSLAVQQLNK